MEFFPGFSKFFALVIDFVPILLDTAFCYLEYDSQCDKFTLLLVMTVLEIHLQTYLSVKFAGILN